MPDDYGMIKVTLDLTDDEGLRTRHPDINGLLHDDESLFLIGSPTDFTTLPFGFITTGAIIIPRAQRKNYREHFLRTHANANYVKASLNEFLLLERCYYFTTKGIEISLEQWISSMDCWANFPDNKDLKFLMMPKAWLVESLAIGKYIRRKECKENGYTGSYNSEYPDDENMYIPAIPRRAEFSFDCENPN